MIRPTLRSTIAVLLVAGLPHADSLRAQSSGPPVDAIDPYRGRISVVSGLSQAALGGGNLEVNWFGRRLMLEYSHGMNLQLTGATLPGDVQEQDLSLRMPWTTGFGVGWRVRPTFDVRLEFKRHRFEAYYEDEDFRGDPVFAYSTTTVGVGAYYRYYPFSGRSSWSRGIVIMPSVRYWPNVASTLAGDAIEYENARTGRRERHEAATQGFPGTGGLVANVSVGYTFGVRPR